MNHPRLIPPEEMAKALKVSPVEAGEVTTEFKGPPTVTIDAEQVFMLYATFCGDPRRTAHAAGISEEELDLLVKRHDWDKRISGLIELRRSDRAGDVERAINRAINFVQAHRYRIFLERVLRDITSKSEEEVYGMLMTERFNKDGRPAGTTLSMKPLADLAAALEKVHQLTYISLCDAPSERAKRKVLDPEDVAEVDIHARIAKALSEMRAKSPPAQLQDVQDAQAQALIDGTPPAG